MPCCAFAAFILSQVVLGFGAVKKFLLRTGDSLDDAPANPATEWRLYGPSPTLETAPRRFGIRTLALAASIEVLLAVGAAYGYHLHSHHHHHHDVTPISVGIR